MTILLAPDKFKGSLTAQEVCHAIRDGIQSAGTRAEIISMPMADGGEGTSDLLTDYCGGRRIIASVMDPLFRVVPATYGISGDGQTAFMEMAKASGLSLLGPNERNPMQTTTLGTGQLIMSALEHGCKKIILGIGGSATNDAGMGMAEALGFIFRSVDGNRLLPIGENLSHVSFIDQSGVSPLIHDAEFTVLCDVDNPLTGISGAAFVYGPQKGASRKDVEALNSGMENFKKVAEATFNKIADFAGAGAAGGLGAGSRIFLNATMSGGFDFISRFIGLEENVRKADIVITGEGKIDSQSLSGKVVSGVSAFAAKHRKRCIAFAGKSDLSDTERNRLGVEKIISLSEDSASERDAMENAFQLLKTSAERMFAQS